MARETYFAARQRLFAELPAQGWRIKRDLKVPQACKDGNTLYFRTQAVYLNDHSTFIDIRSMPTDQFLAEVESSQHGRQESRWQR